MSEPTFHPSIESAGEDNLPKLLRTSAEYVLVFLYGLMPALFIPVSSIPASLTKVFLIVIGVGISLILISLAILREGKLRVTFLFGTLAIFLVAAAGFAGAFFSDDLLDSLVGDDIGQYTAAFTLLLAVIIVSMKAIGQSRQAIIRLYLLLFISAFVIGAYHVARVLFGFEWLTFGIPWLASPTSSPFISWNGLAIFFGLVVFLCVIALDQLPLTRVGQYAMVFVGILSVVLLAIVNFSPVWLVLGVTGVASLIYLVLKNRLSGSDNFDEKGRGQFLAILLTLMVLAASLAVIIGGPRFAAAIAEMTGTSYVEVRPSFTATVDIARSVLAEDPWFGAGPNKFSDAWQTYRDPTINNTIFWNSRFESGYSYLTTSFINTGILGTAVWGIFLLTLLFYGWRILRALGKADRFWRFIALTSLVSVIYLWGMNAVYAPNRTILILTAIMTGVFFLAYSTLVPGRSYTLAFDRSRTSGLLMVGLVAMVFAGAIGGAYFVSKLYQSVYVYNRAVGEYVTGSSLALVETDIADAFSLYPNDTYARQLALYELAEMNRLLLIATPSEDDRNQFQDAAGKGLNAARLAAGVDPTESLNWQVLGQIYSALSLVGIEGAYAEAKKAYGLAREHNQTHPSIDVLEARLEFSAGKPNEARSLAEQALAIKSDYIEALYLLAQIDLAEGKVAEALLRMQNVVLANPQNPIAHYQLGVLLASQQRPDEAITAFEKAVSLDERYANAHYFLALGYLDKGRKDDALRQLAKVLELNPDNADIEKLMEQIESGEQPQALVKDTGAEEGGGLIEEQNNTVDTVSDIDSNLITTNNAVVPSAENVSVYGETATTTAE